MKAVILAAGFGTRMRPLTDRVPKPLLPVGGHPLIYYNLFLLKKYGITDLLINVHYQADLLIQKLGTGADFGMRITYSKEPAILGTGGGIKNLQDLLGSGAFLVMNADILVDINLDRLVAFHQKKGGIATLALRSDPNVTQYGALDIDTSGQIRSILGVPLQKGRFRKRMFTGIHVMETRILDFIPSGAFYSITDTYIEMLKKGEKLFGYSMTGYWADIGVPERYHKVNQQMREGEIRLSFFPDRRSKTKKGESE
jgi:NDP-sugar pyrophosphorylase family protein